MYLTSMGKTSLIVFVNTWNEGQMKSPDIISAVKPVVEAFDRLGTEEFIRYGISSVLGIRIRTC